MANDSGGSTLPGCARLEADPQVALRIAQLSSDLVLLIDAARGELVEVNARLRTTLGLPASTPAAEIALRVHPDDLPALTQQRGEARDLPDDATTYAQYRLRHADGRWCWLRERMTVLSRAPDGRALRVLGVARDISREMQAQAAIEVTAQRFSLALSASGVVVFSQDEDLRYAWIHNPALGRAASQVLGKRDPELFDVPAEGLALESIKRRAMTDRQRVVEDVCMHDKGRETWWRLTVEPVIDRDGSVSGVTCATYDITEVRRAEAERARNLAQLDALIAAAPVAIMFVDHEFRHLRVNRMAGLLTGTDPAAMIGRSVQDVLPLLWPQLQPQYLRARDGGETVADVEIIGAVAAVGQPRSFSCSFFPVPLGDGRRGVGVIVQDITERKLTEDKLLQAKRVADEANAAKDRFLATLSHELRTPLTPILLSARILELKPDDRATVLGRAEVIRRSVETEVRLIDDLLDLTRITRDKIGMSALPVSLHEVAREAAEVCEHDAQAAQIAIDLDLRASAPMVRGDAQRLQQVLWNLLRNAIKFSQPAGRVTLTVDNPEPHTVRASVRDTGIGIDAADLPRLFKPFEQGDASITRQFGGLGLGLAIVQRLVALHCGWVEVHSDGPGQGACFSVLLPVLAGAPAAARPALPPAPTPPRQGGRVLLVEDHVDTAHTLGSLLENAGWQVCAADTAAAALAEVERHAFDLVVSDINLPDGDGCDLLALLRQRGCRAPAIAMTGYGMDADQQRTLAAGFWLHFVKPVEVGTLLAAMDRLLATPQH